MSEPNRNAARLTERQVAEIKASRDSARKLARKYGVSRATIGCIKRGQTWRDVEPHATETPPIEPKPWDNGPPFPAPASAPRIPQAKPR